MENTTNDGREVAVRFVAKGDYVRRTHTAKKVYIRGDYDVASNSYSLIDADDMNREIFIKGNKTVFIDFTY